MSREVLQQALDALYGLEGVGSVIDWAKWEPCHLAVDALRAALAQPEQDTRQFSNLSNQAHGFSQPEQPALDTLLAAARKVMDEFGTLSDGLQDLYQALKNYAPVQQEQEPVGSVSNNIRGTDYTEIARTFEAPLPIGTKLYTAPPRREWVGLTDDDMDCLFPHGSTGWVQEIVKIIEAKLKEKNT
jgi:hypothetical protein